MRIYCSVEQSFISVENIKWYESVWFSVMFCDTVVKMKNYSVLTLQMGPLYESLLAGLWCVVLSAVFSERD